MTRGTPPPTKASYLLPDAYVLPQVHMYLATSHHYTPSLPCAPYDPPSPEELRRISSKTETVLYIARAIIRGLISSSRCDHAGNAMPRRHSSLSLVNAREEVEPPALDPTVVPGSSPSLVKAMVLLNFTPPSFFRLKHHGQRSEIQQVRDLFTFAQLPTRNLVSPRIQLFI